MARLRDEFGDDFGLFGPGGGEQGGESLGNPPISAQPGAGPAEPPTGPPSGDAGSTDKPRDIFDKPERRPPGTEPPQSTSPAGGPPGSNQAPPMPSSPSPVASQPPQPFQPMQPLPMDPGAANVAMRAPSIASPTMPTQPSPAAMRPPAPYLSQPQQYADSVNPRAMFGRAGGLTGGGLGLPGAGNEFENENVLDALIRTILGG